MTEYLTEQEQIQQIKTWLKQYAPTVLAGILVALVISTAWHYWQNYRNDMLLHASSVYDDMLTQKAQNNPDGTRAQAQKLFEKYSHTPYAQMAAMMLARDAVTRKDYIEAIKQYNWVIHHGTDRAIQQIARLREARILISDNRPQIALNLLDDTDDKNFNGLIDELKGDAYLALNNTATAKNYYQRAISELPNAEVIRPILAMKLDNLATPATASSEPG